MDFNNYTGITSFVFTQDESKLLIGDDTGTIRVFDSNDYKLLHEIKAHNAAIVTITLSTDGKILSTNSYDRLIKLWDFSTWELLGSIQEEAHLDFIVALDITSDNKNIIVSDVSGIIRVWDIQSRVLIKEYKTAFGTTYHSAGFITIQNHMLYDKELIRKSEIDICDISTGNVQYRINSDPMWDETIIAISYNGKFVASSYNKTKIRIIHLSTGEITAYFHAHDEFMTDIFFTKDDNHLISVSEDGTIKMWSLDSSELVYKLNPANMSITNVVCFDHNSKIGYINSHNAIVSYEIE